MSKYILMNKNIEVAKIEYIDELDAIVEIAEVINGEYAPYGVLLEEKNALRSLNLWFKNRGIPSYRDGLDSLLLNLGLSAPDELLNRAFSLSLSDQYWLKPINSEVLYEDINFFTNPFNSVDFYNATFFDISSDKLDFFTPNNTSDGLLKKTWIVENDVRYLLKGGYRKSMQEPINERLATMVCEALGFNHTPYEVVRHKDKLMSKCRCFIDENTELITADKLFTNNQKPNNVSDYQHYINILRVIMILLSIHSPSVIKPSQAMRAVGGEPSKGENL